MKSSNLRNPILILIAILGLGLSSLQAQEDLQDLYIKASDEAAAGNFEAALATFEKIIQEYANPKEDYSWDDYGPMFGGTFYDKGVVHLQLSQFQEAKEAFEKCHNDYPNKVPYGSRKEKSRRESENRRWDLALFQWGYAEQQLGNYKEALDLYDRFLDAKPDQSILREVQPSFILRKGVCLIGVGNFDEGEAEITRLFSEYDSFQNRPSGLLLFQAMLELATGWIKKAETDPEAASAAAHRFLDTYGSIFSLSPYEKEQRGLVDRLRLIGFQSNQAGLYSVAIRFFGMVPTTQQIIKDLEVKMGRTGPETRASYEKLIEQYEAKLASPDPTEIENLRLVASAWEGMGNQYAGYAINRYLADKYPESKVAPVILHEAARFAFNLGDGSAAQYYGDQFMTKYPDHELRDNVATYMLHALFRAQKYKVCVDVAGQVRLKYEEGAPQRELADYIYGASLYSLGEHDEAQASLKLHIEKYPDSSNREASRFFYAMSKLSQAKYVEAAPLLDSFLKDYPSSNFKDLVLMERATCYFNATEDTISAINLCDQLLEEFPESTMVDRAYILKADAVAYLGNTPEPGKELKDYQLQAIDLYLNGKDAAERLQHSDFRAEALFKLVDVYVSLENWDEAVVYYDAFFPDHMGHYFEPQVSVYAMPALEAKDRALDGLTQLERMIKQLSESDEVDRLAECIGSYHNVSIRNRGYDQTIAKYDEIIAGGNVTLQTWMMIHKIIAYQEMSKEEGADKDAIDQKIASVFNDLKAFEIKDLSDIALQEIGKYLERTNPFQALPYFEELLVRDNKLFQAPAVMAMGRIEAKSGDPAKVDNAIQRFKRVITEYNAPEYEAKNLIPEAYLNLGRIGVQKKDWKLAREYLTTYINNKTWDSGNKILRAEASHLYGYATKQLAAASSDPEKKKEFLDEAVKVFVANVAAYPAYVEWTAQSVEESFEITYEREWPEEQARDKRKQAYAYLRRQLYSWQKFENSESDSLERLRLLPSRVEAELNLTQEEINDIEEELGIAED